MAEDLAIDVGIPAKTDEFHTFVSCVNNILDHGCGYSSDVTEQICDRCETSQLPIAKKVLRECRRISQNTSNIRPSSQKWWQTWRSKREHTDVPRWPEPADKVQFKAKQKRGKQKRPMSPMFKGKQKRPMSPMFKGQHNRDHRDYRNKDHRDIDRRDIDRRDRRDRDRRDRDHRDRDYHNRDRRDGGGKRYCETSEPEVSYERTSKKRRRYR